MSTPDERTGATPRPRWGALGALTPAMRWALVGVGVVAVVGVILAVALLSGPGASSGGSAPGADGTGVSGDGTSATPGADGTSGSADGARPGATPQPGSEVLPPATDAADPDRLPDIPARTPVLTPPFPASASADGSLVDGYPTEVLPVVDGSDVVSSSISSEDGTMQVTLVARTDASPADIRSFYTRAWSGLGYVPEGDPDSGGLTASDAWSGLSLGFATGTGTGTRYTLFAVFRGE